MLTNTQTYKFSSRQSLNFGLSCCLGELSSFWSHGTPSSRLQWNFELWMFNVFSRPGRSQRLLYKHLCHLFIHWLIDSLNGTLVPTALRRRHAQTVWDRSSSYKIDYVIVIKGLRLQPAQQACFIDVSRHRVQNLKYFWTIYHYYS